MSEQTTPAEPDIPIDVSFRGKWINDEFLRRFDEEFDRAEQAKRAGRRRLEARLATLRALRAAL